jgi:hypothetical protein
MADTGRFKQAFAHIRWAELIVLLLICIAETALIWLAATAIVAVPAGLPHAISPWLVFGLVWGTALLPGALEALDVWEPWHQVVMGAAIVISLIVAILVICFPGGAWRDDAWISEAMSSAIVRPSTTEITVWFPILIVALIWWRAYIRDEPSRETAFRLMRVGSIGILSGAVALAVTDSATGEVESSSVVLVFFLAALTAIGLASLTSGDNAGQAEASFRSVAVGFAPVLAVVVFAVVVSGLLRRDLFDTILWALGPLMWGLSVIVRATILGVALIAVVILSPFLWLMEGRELQFRAIRIDGSGLGSDPVVDRATDGANALPDPLRYLVAAAVLFVLFAGVTRFVLRRQRSRVRSISGEEHTRMRPVFDLSRAIDTLRRLLGLGGEVDVADPLDELRQDTRWAATVRIRERYRVLLVWAAERGVARAPGQTAYEHAAHLEAGIAGAGARDDITMIVAIYSRTRYGSDPATAADAETVETAFGRIERDGQQAGERWRR